jgi:transcriptional regulator with XRE-family HTH domain
MSDNAREIFIKNLRYIMEKKGITQADICRELKIPSATMSNWFTGQRYPRIDKMQQLADMLGVTYSTLTTEHGLQDYEDQVRIEAMHQNPALRMLFDLQMGLKPQSLDAVTAIVKEISKERGDE